MIVKSRKNGRRVQGNKDFSRVKFIRLCFLVVFSVFVARLFQIQVLHHSKYKALAASQHWNLNTLPAKRGDILSSDKYSLATTQVSYLLYAEPHRIADKAAFSLELATVLVELEQASFEEEVKLLNLEVIPEGDSREVPRFESDKRREELFVSIFDLVNRPLYWIGIRNRLTPEQKDFIAEKGIKGIGFEENPIRYYPEGTLASHLLGFVASNEQGAEQGYYGIEGFLNGDLKGKPGRVIQETDALGNPILMGSFRRADAVDGRDLVLTVNRAIQYIVEGKLKEGVERYDAVAGSVIVMDPSTGDILAMANYPSYHPTKFNDEVKQSTQSERRKATERRNIAISDTYEPGSVIKPFTVAAAVDLGLISPHTTFEDNGPVQYSDYVIDNWDGKHHGTQTIVQLLQKSNNIGASWVGHLVGAKNLEKYLKGFGFGTKTLIDLEGEDTGVIREFKSWTDIDLANISFGQGMSATPLQVLTAFNVFANNGELMQPRIVSSYFENDKEVLITPKKINRVISPQTSATMVGMLTLAVEGGESKFFNIKDYKVAGKTGTAQIFVDGKYDSRRTNATFIGFLPESRNFTMLVKLREPGTSPFAAETAVPLWMEIAGELVKFYGIPPDKFSEPAP